MNKIAEDILSYLSIDKDEETLSHYGMKYRSGRYPHGTGENPCQHDSHLDGEHRHSHKNLDEFQNVGDFVARCLEMKREGMTETQIAEYFGMSTGELRVAKGNDKKAKNMEVVQRANELLETGMSKSAVAKELGIAPSTLNDLLAEGRAERLTKTQETANLIRSKIEELGVIDVGKGANLELGVTQTTLDQALKQLEDEGYVVLGGRVQQLTNPDQQTTVKVIGPADTPRNLIYKNPELINPITELKPKEEAVVEEAFPKHPSKMVYPESMDINRLAIRYAEDGGEEKDGLIELRRGVKDLDLGGSHYSQVRILVDGDRYLKGMAVYADDLPDGIDVRFNTNKSKDKSARDVMKKISLDNPENPFGSLIMDKGQSYYYDEEGNQHLSLINKRADEGDWGEWAKKLPSQFLSKQNKDLINRQLNLAIKDAEDDLNDIMALQNPVLKKHFLETYADGADKAAVTLKAAALPRQKYQVILPISSLKDNEIYAPNFNQGEKVALVRFPHGGTFEIPILTVNNRNAEGANTITPQAKDAVGINSKVAARLSGADFDGDTVLVIPTNSKVKITSTPSLKELVGYDPKKEYPGYSGMKVLSESMKQKEMGIVTNLIQDMSVKGATWDEIARATKHSMTVIDATKHELDYKKSFKDNGIQELKDKYQLKEDGTHGASTILTRAKNQVYVDHREAGQLVTTEEGKTRRIYSDPETGEKLYTPTGRTTSTGAKVKVKSTQMAETNDPWILVGDRDSYVEQAYANYASKHKSLANQARKEAASVQLPERDPVARVTYKDQVESLNRQLMVAKKNQYRERQAQIAANAKVNSIVESNPELKDTQHKSELKKVKQSAIAEARVNLGAERSTIKVSDKEWEAIQSNAISKTNLGEMLKYMDLDDLRERAMPKNQTGLSEAKVQRMKALQESGYTQAQIAKALGISTSSVSKYLSQENK